jgi:HD-GYP domain-containing protein (c-di-GMP phosphodiesterase class II)
MERAAQENRPEAPGEAPGRRFESIHLATLAVDHRFDFDLYLKTAGGYSLYRARHTPFTAEDQSRLVANNIKLLYFETSQRAACRKYLIGQFESLATRDHGGTEHRCAMNALCARTVGQDLWRDPQAEHIYEDAGRFVDSTVAMVLADPEAAGGLVRMLRHDYYTFTHLVNVSTLAILLALRLGIEAPDQLSRIGLGGLLHDIGKTRIDPAILNCAKRLTQVQINEIKRHPDYGIDMVVGRPGLSRDAMEMVTQHHERLDGSGYPMGLIGNEISTVARICAVVDVYDAMTCERPYRAALDRGIALEHLKVEAQHHLDAEVVDAWVHMVPEWPLEQVQCVASVQVGAAATGEGGDA